MRTATGKAAAPLREMFDVWSTAAGPVPDERSDHDQQQDQEQGGQGPLTAARSHTRTDVIRASLAYRSRRHRTSQSRAPGVRSLRW